MRGTRAKWIAPLAAAWMVSLAAPVRAAEDLGHVARLLAERLRPVASAPRAPRYFNAFGTAVRCVALTAKEIRSGGRHVFACATQGGEVLGGLLNRKGKPVCAPITGTFDAGTECWSVRICDQDTQGCFPSG